MPTPTKTIDLSNARSSSKRNSRRGAISKTTASRSDFEGVSCPSQARYDWVNYGLLTNERGIPAVGQLGRSQNAVASDRKGARAVRNRAVCDGGRPRDDHPVDALREIGVDWITALRPEAIRKLINDGLLQMGLFDERNLLEVTHPISPTRGWSLAAIRNWPRGGVASVVLCSKRPALELEKVCRMVERDVCRARRSVLSEKAPQRDKAADYRLDIRDDGFDFELDETTMDADASRLASGNSSPTNGSSGATRGDVR